LITTRDMKINIWWLFLLVSTNVFAQKITVIDGNKKSPLEMVVVINDSIQLNALTNKYGEVDISDFKDVEKIYFQLLGYTTLIKSYQEIINQNNVIELIPAVIHLDEIVISGTKWNQSTKEVPVKITSISAQSVALQNPQTAADMLGVSGEVFIQKSQQGGGSPMIRGFSTNRLLYTIDGVRMNNAIFRSGNIQQVISLDAFAIEHTEVLFGPSSVIYGSDAIGGVMSFQTLQPTFSKSNQKMTFSGNAVTRYSSANKEKTGHIDFNIGLKKWAFLSSITYTDFDDLKMGKHGPDEYLRTFYVQRIDDKDSVFANSDPRIQNPTGYSQLNLMQKIRFKPNENWDFQYAFHYSETSEYSRYDRLIEVAPSGLPRSAVWNYGPQIWMMNLLSVQHKKKSLFYDEIHIRMARQYFQESRIDRNFSGGNRFRLRNQTEDVYAHSLNLDFEKKIKKHQLFYGIEAISNKVMSTASAIHIITNDTIPVPDRYPESTWKSYAAYVNYQHKISDKLFSQIGVRYNHYAIESDFTRHLEFYPFDFTTTEINNSALTGSIGAVYTPQETWRISFNLSSGFRAPNVDDIGKIFDFTGGDVVVPNANLTAEHAYNADINIAKVFSDVVKFDFSAYYTYLDNALVRREFQVDGQDSIFYNGSMKKVYAIQNAAFGDVYGFHAGLEIKLPYDLVFSSRYNYQIGKEEMDNGEVSRSRHAAPAFGTTRLTYTKNKLKVQLYAIYNAQVKSENLNEEERQKQYLYAQDSNGNPYSPAWYTLNIKAMYQVIERVSITAGVENITNQRYRPYSSGLVAAGTNVVCSLRLSY
jgi:hemoglobin/transferrin/lactoferrin receptor protein